VHNGHVSAAEVTQYVIQLLLSETITNIQTV